MPLTKLFFGLVVLKQIGWAFWQLVSVIWPEKWEKAPLFADTEGFSESSQDVLDASLCSVPCMFYVADGMRLLLRICPVLHQ